jgi:hypothetical protein
VRRYGGASLDIHQLSFQTQIKINPLDWLSTKFEYTAFSYDQDVNAFMQSLSNARVVSLHQGLATTLGGFPLEEYKALLTFYFLSDWDFEPTVILERNITDGLWVETYKGVLSRQFGSFRAGLGYQRDESSSTTDNVYLVNVSYDF